MVVDVGFSEGLLEGTSEVSGPAAAEQLRLKGYCVVELGFGGDAINDALDEISVLGEQGHFSPPPSQILPGLLGEEGSGALVELGLGVPGEDSLGGEALRNLNAGLGHAVNCTLPYCGANGWDMPRRTAALLLRGGSAEDERTELTEQSCSKWLDTFLSARLMLLYFLGRGSGKLELRPLDDDSEPVYIKTEQDMLVILRCDVLSHQLTSTSNNYVLSCWVVTLNTGTRGWRAMHTSREEKLPAVQDLKDWAQDRMQFLMRRETEEGYSANVPRTWQRAMHHEYFRNSTLPVAVRGVGTRYPGTDDCETFWRTLNGGTDYAREVPLERWDHTEYYDPDPCCYLESQNWKFGTIKTHIRHGQFIDGADIFDCKFFGISRGEAQSMEPGQRNILETSYDALFASGYRKKDLMNATIAVFTGCTHPEANYLDWQGFGAGTTFQSIVSNRTSFCLGMMGPSASTDCEMASAAMALLLGAAAVTPSHARRMETGGTSKAAVCGGIYLMLSPFMWPRYEAWMNPIGRCFTFDQEANGYIRGECCVSVVLNPYCHVIDGELVVDDAVTCLGTLISWRMTSNGKNAQIGAPSAPAIQECVLDALRDASIDALDLDCVECHGVGGLLEDCVEVSALAKALRHGEGCFDEPLLLGAVKTNTGAQCEASGITSFVKIIYSILYACHVPVLHLKQANPHINALEENPIFASGEGLACRDQCSFCGTTARGLGGTNVHLVTWFSADEDRVCLERPASDQSAFAFWPAGGGVLERSCKPLSDYYIVGSWNDWSPVRMESASGQGQCFTCAVTLGESGVETFQIWLDGDADQALHPNMVGAPSGTAVHGPCPVTDVMENGWYINPGSGNDGDQSEALGAGAQYLVRLAVAGKYRAVTWEPLLQTVASECAPLALAEPAAPTTVRHFVAGTFNEWGLEEMVPSADAPGLYVANVALTQAWGDFQIICDGDWAQRLHPSFPGLPPNKAYGPADVAYELCWRLRGRAGDLFRIDLRRAPASSYRGHAGSISWRRVDPPYKGSGAQKEADGRKLGTAELVLAELEAAGVGFGCAPPAAPPAARLDSPESTASGFPGMEPEDEEAFSEGGDRSVHSEGEEQSPSSDEDMEDDSLVYYDGLGTAIGTIDPDGRIRGGCKPTDCPRFLPVRRPGASQVELRTCKRRTCGRLSCEHDDLGRASRRGGQEESEDGAAASPGQGGGACASASAGGGKELHTFRVNCGTVGPDSVCHFMHLRLPEGSSVANLRHALRDDLRPDTSVHTVSASRFAAPSTWLKLEDDDYLPDEVWVSHFNGTIKPEMALTQEHCREVQKLLQRGIATPEFQEILEGIELATGGSTSSKYHVRLNRALTTHVYPGIAQYFKLGTSHPEVTVPVEAIGKHLDLPMAEQWLELATLMRDRQAAQQALEVADAIRASSEVTVRVSVCTGTSDSPRRGVLHAQLPQGSCVGALRVDLGWALPPTAEVLEIKPGGKLVSLADHERLPPEVAISELWGDIPQDRVLTRAQCREAQSLIRQAVDRPEVQWKIEDIDVSTKGKSAAFRAKLRLLLMTEVYPAIVGHFGLEAESGPIQMNACLMCHSLCSVVITENWLDLERRMRNYGVAALAEGQLMQLRTGACGLQPLMSGRRWEDGCF